MRRSGGAMGLHGGRAMSVDCLSAMAEGSNNFSSIQQGPSANTTKVHFIIRARLEIYQELRLLGDAPQLGGWDITQAQSLIRENPQSPLWTCTAMLTTGVPVEYKYVIVTKGDIADEPNKEVRTAHPKGIDMWIDDEWVGMDQQLGDRRVRINRGVKRRMRGDKAADEFSQMALSGVMEEQELVTTDQVIVCVFRLPVKCSRDSDNNLQFEMDSDALYRTHRGLVDALSARVKLVHVGLLWGVDVDEMEEDEVAETLLRDFSCIPVFVNEQTRNAMYWGYCKGILWPLFHSVMDLTSGSYMKQYDDRLWRAYITVNRKFAEAVVEIYADTSSAIWVHDYHLLLLPGILRRKLGGCNIGFFLHTPFPTSEIFRVLPHREDILKGLLCSSLIGFHMFDFTRHFLSSCVRILGLDHRQVTGGFLAVEYGGRTVTVRVSHVGVTPSEWGGAAATPNQIAAMSPNIQGMLTACQGSKVMTSAMNDYDRLKGAPLQLIAFERLLKEYQQWQNQVVFVMICPVPPQRDLLEDEDSPKGEQFAPGFEGATALQSVEDAHLLRDEILEHRERINSSFPGSVHYLECDLSTSERREVYALSDIMLVTPVRDGLNLVPYEYVATEPNAQRKASGVLILSEFTGCSRALCGGLRINPWDIDKFVTAMDKALSSPERDRNHTRQQDLKYVNAHTTAVWARSFLDDLETCYEPMEKMTTLGLGFGMSFNTLEPSAQNTNTLEYEDMAEGYETSAGRLFLLDCEGTIKVDGSRPPTPGMIKALQAMCADPKNIVMVMSGRPRHNLEQWFGMVPNLGMAAENGFYFKVPRHSEEWVCMDPTVDLTWTPVVEGIMREYCERTDGAQMSITESHLRWVFRDTDQEFGHWQALQLKEDLEQVISPGTIEVNVSSKAVVVHPKNLNRGHLVAKLATMLPEMEHPLEFVACFGDDRADEDTFAAINAQIPENARITLYTCTVGRKNSFADYFVDGMDNVEFILSKLGEVSNQAIIDA